MLVLAGAGSGKTRVITRRVAHLVSRGVSPWSILAITFTNKAAGEMSRRVEELGVPRGSVIGTFHAFCVRLLREFADQTQTTPGRNFTIYDRDDQTRCIKEAMKHLEISDGKFAPGAVLSTISRAKNGLVDAGSYAEKASGIFEKTAAKVYKVYQRILAGNGAMDFDDLLFRTACLMRDRTDIRELLGRRYRYVLIDEYQDTNKAQYLIAHSIAFDHHNICVTGDPDQSIYAWRGADVGNILRFESDYPDALVVYLEQNYRSTQPILTAADSLIARNFRRKHKRLIATRPGGENVGVIRLDNEHIEAFEVADIVTRLHRRGTPYRDVAVFYRVNSLSRVLEEAFVRFGIAYQIARGVEFYNRREIKDVLAYLRLLVNHDDDVSCRRIINVPARGIGQVTVKRLSAAAEARGVSLLAACAEPEKTSLGKAAAAKVAAFARLIDELSEKPDRPVRKIVEMTVVRTGIEDALRRKESKPAGDEPGQALRNIGELISATAEFDQGNPDGTLADYLYQVSLVSDIDSIRPESGAVTFMTLHAAKGLEFPVVIMVGCEENLLPFRREKPSGENSSEVRDLAQADIEEERRLAFVGITRAKDRLYMTSARYRLLRGRKSRQVESPFLLEIGNESVSRIDKTTPDPPPQSTGANRYDRRSGSTGDGFYENVDQRAIIEAMENADSIPAEFSRIHRGRLVRHNIYGSGKVLQISYDGARTRAVVEFQTAGKKTLILEHANLDPM